MGLDVHRGQAQQHVERSPHHEKQLAAAVKGKHHEYGSHSHVRAGERCGGPFARCLGPVGVSRCGKTLAVGVEIVVHVGEYACRRVAYTYRLIIICGSGDRHKYEYHVIDEERRQHYEGATLELLIPAEEIEKHHQGYQRIVGGVAKTHKLAHDRRREARRKGKGGLESEHRLLERGEHVVEVREHPVELISVGIPPGKQHYLRNYARGAGQPARHEPVDHPQRDYGCEHPHASEHHCLGVDALCIGEEQHHERERGVRHDSPLHGKQSAHRLLLNLEKFLYVVHFCVTTICYPYTMPPSPSLPCRADSADGSPARRMPAPRHTASCVASVCDTCRR